MKKLLFTLLLLTSATCLLAQSKKGEVEEIKDPEIDRLIAKRAYLYTQPHEVKGYRIQLYSGNSREGYLDSKQKFISLYPNMQTDMKYVSPNFKLYVGECITYAEALKLKTKLQKDFAHPRIVNGSFTVND